MMSDGTEMITRSGSIASGPTIVCMRLLLINCMKTDENRILLKTYDTLAEPYSKPVVLP